VSRGAAVQDLVAAGIVAAATGLLADATEPPTMARVAQAAGVARATLYRYFPTREDLIDAMVASALVTTHDALLGAGLDVVDLREGLARVCRVLIPGRARFAVLESVADGVNGVDRDKVEQAVTGPVLVLFARGLDSGELRPDLTARQHLRLFGGVLKAAMEMVSRDGMTVEEAAALAPGLFLDGAAARSAVHIA